jgi:hypothetical protein
MTVIRKVLGPFSADNIAFFGGFCRTNRKMELLPGSFHSAVVRAYNMAESFKNVQSSDLRIPDSGSDHDMLVLILSLAGMGIVLLLARRDLEW